MSNATPMIFCKVYTFCTSSVQNDDPPEDGLDDADEESDVLRDVERIVGIFRNPLTSMAQASLEELGDVKVKREVVCEVLSRLRNDWEAAYTFFLWAGKQPGHEHSVRELHSMIAILGKMRKFDTALSIIDEMRGVRTGRNLVTHQTLLIMIRRYCAVHDVGKAISTFYAYKRFKLEVGLAEFQDLLSALCRYKNVKDAEHLMFANKDVYPMDTKSFNIVLNGWCNVVGNIREGDRIWKVMKERSIKRDSYSYASIMSGFSKGKNINVVFKLFKEMKSSGVEPDRKVYNAVIHALAKGKLVKEAQDLMKTMEGNGISPTNVTYNSLILPLCKKYQLDTAKEFFNEMVERGLCPSIRTYHSFFRGLRTEEEVFELLERMYATGCHPTHETYIMLIRKFCRWRQIDNAYKMWNEMSKKGVDPDRSSYIVLIHGLFLNGKLTEAHKYYLEMIKKDLQPEPKVEEMIQAWLAGKREGESHAMDLGKNPAESGEHGNNSRVTSKNENRERNFLQIPESRRIKRERGFSFVED
ncbi:hypothetical protein Leryth_006568 [Lithospermum erythrorhizon]|nr:hypothetical protein Leryth_006568 [Lithospermum erythrorhizon]